MAKILVVDDIKDITEIIHYFLEEDGHEVVTVNSSHNAIVHLENDNYQILITDMLMPEVNGFELIQDVRKPGSENQSPKIIAISGGVSGLGTETILNAASIKADIVIKKPFTREELLSAIKRHAGQAG